MKSLFFLIASLLFHLTAVFSQSGINAELRPRFILDNGYIKPRTSEDKPLSYVTQRTRLNAFYNKEQLETYISIQDVRFWGGDNKYKESGTSGNTESLSLHQGWIKLKPGPRISLTAGRQLFIYDDQRILGARDWNDAQVTYDALLFRFDDTLNRLDLALTWNAESSSSSLFPEEKFRLFDFVRYERVIDPVNVSVIMLLTGNTINDTTETLFLRGTFGLNLTARINDLNARATLYHQRHLNLQGGELNAYCLSFFISQRFFRGKATAGAGLDFLTGQDGTNQDADYQGTDHRFDILYGKRHGFYGYMDYFSNLPHQGLQDYMLKTEYKPHPSLSVQADYHYFMLATHRIDAEDPAKRLPNQLGQELDFLISWNPSREINLKAGYSFYLTTRTLEQVKEVYGTDIRFPRFAYLMLTVKPEIFKAAQQRGTSSPGK